jgi:CelD/BcsL family acetyltransferase involved in cellulose biosynthesis
MNTHWIDPPPAGREAPSAAEIEWIDPLRSATWDDGVLARKDHSVFHRAAWAKVLVESYGHRPFYLAIHLDGAGPVLVPMMEVRSAITGRRGVSLPFSDFAGPLWKGASRAAAVFPVLGRFAAQRPWRYLEIRGSQPAPPGVSPARSYHEHRLDLRRGAEDVFRRFPGSTRRAIRHAGKSGLRVVAGRSESLLEEFYRLHCRTRRRHGLPPQPPRFFALIHRHLMAAGLGETIVARRGRTAVAGAVFLRSGGNGLYKFGASDPEHWPLRPNHLVMWTGIERLAAAGCDSLHLGRSCPTDRGLGRFKLSWASTEGALGYFRYHVRRAHWLGPSPEAPAEGHPAIFGRLPLVINRCAGSLLYPHLD